MPGIFFQFPELGDGLWHKGGSDHSRRGGRGVNKNSGRSAKSFLLRPWPTGGSASRFAPNSPKNSPDAPLFGSMLGGGRSHDVEALRNMMTIRAKRGWTGTK